MPFEVRQDPFINLELMVKEAAGHGLKDANAMSLATVSDLKPSVRIVLYKGLIRGGLSFYTNYDGRKGRELEANPNASVCFFWPTLDRQVRVEGKVARLTRAESDAYFKTRARLSQLSAWASHQSEVVAGPQVLAKAMEDFEKKFAGQDVSCPPNWGGYHLIPSVFEFWFGRQGRLHDRFCYERDGNGWREFMRSP